MQKLVGFICLLAVGCAYAGEELNLVKKATKTCMEEMGESNIWSVAINKHKLGCLQTCIYRQLKIIRGDEFDLKNLDFHTKALFSELLDITIECAKKTNSYPPKDDCDLSDKLQNCVQLKLISELSELL